MSNFMGEIPPWLHSLIILVAAPVIALLVHSILDRIFTRLARLTTTRYDESVIRHARKPTRALLVLLAVLAALPTAGLSVGLEGLLRHAAGVLLIGTVGWIIIAASALAADLIRSRYDIKVSDNLTARSIYTQVQVLHRIVVVIVVVITGAVILMTFPAIRNIGQSILASAGVGGLVIGLAARPTLSNLIAGVQLALSQPIRVDDVVIVENEWGRIEEITTTFVVICTWDWRRLVVPLNYFIEHPFQNWTRTQAQLIGSVYLHTDYHVPVDEIRAEVKRILATTDLWDQNVVNVQVTDTTERTVEVRVLVSSPDSGKAWDLRCLVREGLLNFLRERYPESLPRTRVELRELPGTPAKASAA